MTNRSRGDLITNVIDNLLRIGVAFILAISVVSMVIALVDSSSADQEADIGSFDTTDLNDGWTLSIYGREEPVTLPVAIDAGVGDTVTLVNHLPGGVSDGMTLMFRAAMEDVTIQIDGEVRQNYSSEDSTYLSYYIPSAYVVTDLNSEDAGKEITLSVTFKAKPVINGITLGYGNNGWFSVIKTALPTVFSAVLILISGTGLLIVTVILHSRRRIAAPRNLGLLMVDVALWVLSESTIRQLIFVRPSLSQYFAYFTVEMIGILSWMYFDAVQHRIYHKIYMTFEAVGLSILILNIFLQFIGVAELYKTIIISHAWTGVGAIVSIILIVIDIYTKRIRQYGITGIGIICFVLMASCELVAFYINRFHVFGSYVCIALLILMIATVAQTMTDEINSRNARDRLRQKMTIHAIETITSAIDARDEYTGGHSERVGRYAECLAREMAADYDFSEEDILRVRYIGLMHDIGKIGVADGILNKASNLDYEEFNLMKKHSAIGYEIMSSFGDEVPDLLNGIRYHHERFDGHGYPDGLSDTDIPLVARIIALADSYDAMTSNRVYRKHMSDEEVREELLKRAGTQFDPALTEIFVRLIDRGELRADTIDGVAVSENGEVLVSSLLETNLHKDLMNGRNISNPTHIRMLCYLIKLMEKKGKTYSVFFAGPDDSSDSETWNRMLETFKEYVGEHDVNIRYTDSLNVIALFDRSDEETMAVKDAMRANCPTIVITDLK